MKFTEDEIQKEINEEFIITQKPDPFSGDPLWCVFHEPQDVAFFCRSEEEARKVWGILTSNRIIPFAYVDDELSV